MMRRILFLLLMFVFSPMMLLAEDTSTLTPTATSTDMVVYYMVNTKTVNGGYMPDIEKENYGTFEGLIQYSADKRYCILTATVKLKDKTDFENKFKKTTLVDSVLLENLFPEFVEYMVYKYEK